MGCWPSDFSQIGPFTMRSYGCTQGSWCKSFTVRHTLLHYELHMYILIDHVLPYTLQFQSRRSKCQISEFLQRDRILMPCRSGIYQPNPYPYLHMFNCHSTTWLQGFPLVCQEYRLRHRDHLYPNNHTSGVRNCVGRELAGRPFSLSRSHM